MSKWDDDDDVVRPAVQSKKDLRGELEDWQTKVNAAANTSKESALPQSEAPAQRATLTKVERNVVDDASSARKLSDEEIQALAMQARSSAQGVAHAANESKTVRLRTKVGGWYEGSVPAVDFCDGRGHFFPRAPTRALDNEEQYLNYWRKPFVAHLRLLGFQVLEQDL